MSTEKRYGFVGIIVTRDACIADIQKILSENSHFVLGRMGLPHLDNDKLSVITLIIHATTDELGLFTGKLGKIKGVKVKSALN